jgi:hypothetical protein
VGASQVTVYEEVMAAIPMSFSIKSNVYNQMAG